jgi:hypothetical protein
MAPELFGLIMEVEDVSSILRMVAVGTENFLTQNSYANIFSGRIVQWLPTVCRMNSKQHPSCDFYQNNVYRSYMRGVSSSVESGSLEFRGLVLGHVKTCRIPRAMRVPGLEINHRSCSH